MPPSATHPYPFLPLSLIFFQLFPCAICPIHPPPSSTAQILFLFHRICFSLPLVICLPKPPSFYFTASTSPSSPPSSVVQNLIHSPSPPPSTQIPFSSAALIYLSPPLICCQNPHGLHCRSPKQPAVTYIP